MGNDNAVGNSGGGAPRGNENAYKYGAWCDPGLLYDRLWGDAKEVVDGDIEAYAERYRKSGGEEPTEEMMEEFKELATMGRQRRLAMNRSFEIGVKEAGCLIVEREKEFEIDGETVTRTVHEENPAVMADLQLSSKMRNKTDELNLYPQPK